VLAPAAADDSSAPLAVVGVETTESAGLGEERLHAARAARASRIGPRRFVIETQR
jgi:hypothetical protein